MLEEHLEGVGDQVAGGLVAGHAEQDEEHVELVLAQAVAVDLGVHERRHDVVAGARPAVLDERVAVGVDLGRRHLAVLVGGAEVLVLHADEAVAPVEDQVPVLVGHADHLADHLERQLGRHLLHELDLLAPGQAVEDALGLLVDVLDQAADHARREPGAHEPPVAAVLGRVHVEQREARPWRGRPRPCPGGTWCRARWRTSCGRG
ncbi:MAG: hypothetical protein R2711_02860 [Acidimicrobiales bacterium]